MTIAITYNLRPNNNNNSHKLDDRYIEYDEIETIYTVRDAINERYKEVVCIEADKNAFEKLQRVTPYMVFNMAEGVYGNNRESQIPIMLEMLDIPFTGSDALTLAICLDKSRTKEILSYYNVPVSPFFVCHSNNDVEKIGYNKDNNYIYLNKKRLYPPVIIKPVREGSSKGIMNDISLIRDPINLKDRISQLVSKYNQPVIIEEFLEGREFTVALLGNGDNITVLPIVEIIFDNLPKEANPIYSYEAKWLWDTPDNPIDIFHCPAVLRDSERVYIERLCRKVFNILRCRDWCRIDLRLNKNGIPNIIEVNPIPGIIPDPKANSCFPKAARTAGITYSNLIHKILDIAWKRYNASPKTVL